MHSRMLQVLSRPSLIQKNVQLLPCHGHSPDFSPLKNVSSIVDKQLAHHHKSTTTVELQHLAEAA